MKKIVLVAVLSLSAKMYAQEEHYHLKTQIKAADTTQVKTIQQFFHNGWIGGHFRNYTMATINAGDLTDYYTNATGAAFHYETANLYGFRLGIKGIFTYNLFGSDLNAIDPIAGKSAKWEKELYDINNPYNTKHMDRLEELYLKYENHEIEVVLGKQDIGRTPLLSRRDGRMKPFVFEGISLAYNRPEKARLSAAWLFAASPRSMVEWYAMNETIGKQANGVQPNGVKANYHKTAQTKGVGFVGIECAPNTNVKANYWLFYFDQLFFANYAELILENNSTTLGIQSIVELPHKKQSALEYEKRYMQPDELPALLAAKLEYRLKHFKWSLNASKIFKSGRFLFPRELGREAVYTSVPRSWVDGLGAAELVTLKCDFAPQNPKWKGFSINQAFTSAWLHQSPAFNKYQLASYFQSNTFLRYRFNHFLKGYEIALLYIYKADHPGAEWEPAQSFNLSNYHQINFVQNINF